MKPLLTSLVFLLSLFSFAQGPLKMDVPMIDLSENQQFQVLSYEATAVDEFSVLYMQEMPATVIASTSEFLDIERPGAYATKTANGLQDYIPHSNRALFLIRQTFKPDGSATTKFWVVALRSLQSAVDYKMFYPQGFVHPIIADAIPISHSLQNVDQIPDLTTQEFSALVIYAKSKYNFYEYPRPTYVSSFATLADDIRELKSGFRQLKDVVGNKRGLPSSETVLFKRRVLDDVILAGTRVKEGDGVVIKLYLSYGSESEFELLDSESYKGSANPLFATAIGYDQTLHAAGAYGWVVLKYKDENGKQSRVIVAGIDWEGEPHFWKLDVGKNGLNSFTPYFSYSTPEGIYVVSQNRDKVFKPFYQHHLLKYDGKVETLFPTTETEIGSEKSEFIHTAQPTVPASPAAVSSTPGISKTIEPVGIFDYQDHRFIFTNAKTVNSTGTVKTTEYGNLSVLHIDEAGKVKESYEIQQHKSGDQIIPFYLGEYSNEAYYLINYRNMFKLKLSQETVTPEALETDAFRLVRLPNNDVMSVNEHGIMLLTKSAVGNSLKMEFYPKN